MSEENLTMGDLKEKAAAIVGTGAAAKPQGSVESRAWNATKSKDDPDWDHIANLEFKGKLQFAADRVKATGTAQTNFEHKVLELHVKEAKEEEKVAGPMAVTAGPMATV